MIVLVIFWYQLLHEKLAYCRFVEGFVWDFSVGYSTFVEGFEWDFSVGYSTFVEGFVWDFSVHMLQ
jgi:hypothetical protein